MFVSSVMFCAMMAEVFDSRYSSKSSSVQIADISCSLLSCRGNLCTLSTTKSHCVMVSMGLVVTLGWPWPGEVANPVVGNRDCWQGSALCICNDFFGNDCLKISRKSLEIAG